MAPEQARDPAAVDKRADIYAIGVLLFEALCGERPFHGETLGELIGAHLFQVAEKPSAVHLRKALPPRAIDWRLLDAIVAKALAKEPGSRYQDCASLRHELEAAWGHRGQWAEATQGYSSQSGFAPAAARPTSRLALVGGAALMLGVLGGGLWWSVGHKPRAGVVVDDTPLGLATARLQAAQRGGLAERRALVAAVELVRSRVLLPYVEAALRDPAAAVWPAAVPVAAAIGIPGDAGLRELLAQRAAQPAGAVAVDLAAARLRLGDADAATGLSAAARGDAVVPRLRATLALALGGLVTAPVLQQVLLRSVGTSSVPPALRQAVLVQLVKMADATTEKQLQQALQGASPEPAANKGPAADRLAAQDAADEALAVYARAGRLPARTQLLQAAQKAAVPRRLELAVALADAGDARALELLLPLFRDGTPRIRQRAAGALGSLGTTGGAGAPALANLLGDPDPGVSLTAAAALLAVSPAPSSRPAVERPEPERAGVPAHG
jgi:HEAT repeat protein